MSRHPGGVGENAVGTDCVRAVDGPGRGQRRCGEGEDEKAGDDDGLGTLGSVADDGGEVDPHGDGGGLDGTGATAGFRGTGFGNEPQFGGVGSRGRHGLPGAEGSGCGPPIGDGAVGCSPSTTHDGRGEPGSHREPGGPGDQRASPEAGEGGRTHRHG